MIKLTDVNYIYQEGMPFENHALHNINLEIPDGTITAIIGHTGSGKSTLIQLFNGLIRPTSGEISVNGINIAKKGADMKKLRQTAGLVFQYPEHQLFEETVYRDIAFGPKNMDLSDEETRERVKNAMSAVGLSENYAQCSPFELSGGQKRRVAIAGVLAMKPQILILDEPTAGLDPKGRNDILDIIEKLHRDNPQMIIILVSHSMEDVAKVADNVVVMNKGRIFTQGDVPYVFSCGEELNKIGLDVPQITKLLQKLHYLGYPVPKDIYTVKSATAAIKSLMGGDKNAQ